MSGTPPPIIPNIQADFLAELDDQDLLDTILYEGSNGQARKFSPSSGPSMILVLPLNPTGELGLHYERLPGSLDPRRKGPYILPLTTSMVIKVDGIALWVHYTHARPADPFTLKEDYQDEVWEVSRDLDNPSNPMPGAMVVDSMAPVGDGTHRHLSCRKPTCPWNQTWININTDSGIIASGTTSK